MQTTTNIQAAMSVTPAGHLPALFNRPPTENRPGSVGRLRDSLRGHCRRSISTMDRLTPILLMTLASFALAASVSGQKAEYFRVISSSDSEIASMDRKGVLTWTATEPTGNYSVERTSMLEGGEWTPLARGVSTASQTSLKVLDFSPPAGMAFIPAGYFTMGDSLGDFTRVHFPPHTVTVSAFYIDRYEVTNEKMAQVLQWALDNGKIKVENDMVVNLEGQAMTLLVLKKWDSVISFVDNQFRVRANKPGHPCVWVSWYGAVAFANFLSDLQGKERCVNFEDWSCDFSKVGYRLPTEAEWEKAARGGLEGKRFPWGDLITHSNANYNSTTNNAYDVSPTRGYHPLYADRTLAPETNPVDAFAPNGFGLYNMAGNAWEWCWDRAGVATSKPETDPVGPLTGLNRIFKGGSWMTSAERLTCALKYLGAEPGMTFDDIGFRLVLPYRP